MKNQKLAQVVRDKYPTAKYVDAVVAFDTINRCNNTYNYQVLSANQETLITFEEIVNSPETLNEHREFNSSIHRLLPEIITFPVEDWEADELGDDQYLYRIDLDTMEYEDIALEG